MIPNLDPFAPVRLAPLMTSGGLSPDRRAVILTVRNADDTERDVTVGHTGADHRLTTNQQVVDAASDILEKAFAGADLASDRTLFDGMHFEARWLLPIEAPVSWLGGSEVVRMTATAHNCYDDSTSSRLALNAIVRACTNGLVISEHLGDYTLAQFEASSPEYAAETGRIAAEVVSNPHWSNVISRFNQMASSPLGQHALEKFRLEIPLPESMHEEIHRRLEGDTVWSLYMAATAVLSHEPNFAKEGLNRLVSLYFLNPWLAFKQEAIYNQVSPGTVPVHS
jgi:hypothetical protein